MDFGAAMKGAFLAAFLTCAGLARGGSDLAGTTDLIASKFGAGARAVAMGDAFTAVGGDPSSLSYNPAGVMSSRSAVEAGYGSWFGGVSTQNLQGLASLGDAGSLGLGFTYLSFPGQDGTVRTETSADPNSNFVSTGSFVPMEYLVQGGYGLPVGKIYSVGLAVKAGDVQLDGTTAMSAAADLGALAKFLDDQLCLGVSVQNISLAGNGPLAFKAGADYHLLDGNLMLVADADVPVDNVPDAGFGLEYRVAFSGGALLPRAGYRYDNIFNPWSAGVGIRVGGWNLDFAAVPTGDFGLSYRGTAGFTFGSSVSRGESGRAAAATDVLSTGKLLIVKRPTLVPGATAFHFVVQAPAEVRFAVYHGGKFYRIIPYGKMQPGAYKLHFDGKGDDGYPLPAGDYSFQFRAIGEDGTIDSQLGHFSCCHP
jgi:hypothetical protein